MPAPLLAALAKLIASKAMASPVQDMSGGADLPQNHPEVGGGGSGLVRGAAAAYLGNGGPGDVGGSELDLTAGGGKAGSGVSEGALKQMGGDSPYVGGARNRMDPELAGMLAKENDPNYLRMGAAALTGYHQGGLMGAVEGWQGSVGQQQEEYERKMKRRFYGNAAKRAGGL